MTTAAYQRIQKLVADGGCRNCGKVRGPDGTAHHCRTCAEKHNARRRKTARRHECGLCLEQRPFSEFRTSTRPDGSVRRALACKRCEAVARRVRVGLKAKQRPIEPEPHDEQ
jgi:hypothetical protein